MRHFATNAWHAYEVRRTGNNDLMFSFEHIHLVTEAEYITLFGLQQPGSIVLWVKRFVILAFGLLMLLWPYTLGLGIIILAAGFLAILAPHLFPGTAARTFRQMRFLQEPLTYGASDKHLWIKGSDFDVQVPWRLLTVWREREGWFILQASAFPPVLLPVDLLRAQELYEPVKALAKRHAVEFGSIEAQLRF